MWSFKANSLASASLSKLKLWCFFIIIIVIVTVLNMFQCETSKSWDSIKVVFFSSQSIPFRVFGLHDWLRQCKKSKQKVKYLSNNVSTIYKTFNRVTILVYLYCTDVCMIHSYFNPVKTQFIFCNWFKSKPTDFICKFSNVEKFNSEIGFMIRPKQRP